MDLHGVVLLRHVEVVPLHHAFGRPGQIAVTVLVRSSRVLLRKNVNTKNLFFLVNRAGSYPSCGHPLGSGFSGGRVKAEVLGQHEVLEVLVTLLLPPPLWVGVHLTGKIIKLGRYRFVNQLQFSYCKWYPLKT